MASGPFDFHGLDVNHPLNRIVSRVSMAVNVRAYQAGGITFRNLLTNAILTLASAVHTIKRLNDQTNPSALPTGYIYISGAATTLYAGSTAVGAGFSGNPLSVIPFRPNTSVKPYAYIGDSAIQGNVVLTTQYLINGDATTFVTNGMVKVASSKIVWKSGIKEPQLAPEVSTSNSTITIGPSPLLAKTIPWTNYLGQNTSYNYTETQGFPGTDGTAPFIVDVANATTVTITAITGTATINGGTATPTTLGPSPAASTNPGHYIQAEGTGSTPPTTATVVIGAFTDGSGNVVPVGVAPLYVSSVFDAGANIGTAVPIPYGAQDLQIGINTTGNGTGGGGFNSNSGQFQITVQVTTDALPSVTSILGTMTAWYFGDSPTSGPTGSYIWKNPDDPGGSGPTRSTTDAVGSTTGNSFIFDCSFGSSASPAQAAGIPGLPGAGTTFSNPVTAYPMNWSQLNSDDVVTATKSVFSSPITSTYTNNTQFTNFNFCLTGNIYFPSAGNYTFVLTNHDDVIWGIGGGVTLVSATTSGSGEGGVAQISDYGQTITVVGGYPLLPKEKYTNGRVENTRNAPLWSAFQRQAFIQLNSTSTTGTTREEFCS